MNQPVVGILLPLGLGFMRSGNAAAIFRFIRMPVASADVSKPGKVFDLALNSTGCYFGVT